MCNHAKRNMTDKIEDIPWFHPNVSRHTAESLLLQNGVDGTYMLRDSSKLGQYALSVRCDQAVQHFYVERTGDVYKFGHGEFSGVDDLTNHFANKPMIGSESGQMILLNCPYPRDIKEPNLYETVRVHVQLTQAGDNVKGPELSINSKEGYMTKLGYIFKTWKSRWFVLQKNELKYFKNKKSKRPIRALDLHECTQCARDSSIKGHFNVFRLVFPRRTFYMYSCTEQESRDWINLINWKLRQIREGAAEEHKEHEIIVQT